MQQLGHALGDDLVSAVFQSAGSVIPSQLMRTSLRGCVSVSEGSVLAMREPATIAATIRSACACGI